MRELIIVKLGGSVITQKDEEMTFNDTALDLISNELSRVLRSVKASLIVIHGGGSFGHPLARKSGYRYAPKAAEAIGRYPNDIGRTVIANRSDNHLKNYSAIKSTMEELNRRIAEIFLSHDLAIVPFHPSDFCTASNGELYSMYTDHIQACLTDREIPLIHGDVVKDRQLNTAILSGDQLLYHLAMRLKDMMKFVILGTDVGGIYDNDPKKDRTAKRISTITPAIFEKLNLQFANPKFDVTGGMRQKVDILLRLAEVGIQSIVIDPRQKGVWDTLIREGIRKDLEWGSTISNT